MPLVIRLNRGRDREARYLVSFPRDAGVYQDTPWPQEAKKFRSLDRARAFARDFEDWLGLDQGFSVEVVVLLPLVRATVFDRSRA